MGDYTVLTDAPDTATAAAEAVAVVAPAEILGDRSNSDSNGASNGVSNIDSTGISNDISNGISNGNGVGNTSVSSCISSSISSSVNTSIVNTAERTMLGVTAATDGTTAGGTTAGGTTAGGTTADGGQPRSTMETKEWLESINRRHNLSETRATMSLAADGADDAGGVVFDHSLDTSSALGNGQERVRVLSRARE
jgi:hypothetical protein